MFALTQVQPPLEFIPPSFNPVVLRLTQWAIRPLYQQFLTNIRSIEIQNLEQLADLYSQFQAGKIRLLLAFRHPSTYDPLCLGYTIWQELPKIARQQQIPLSASPHFHFIYDRGIPLWAGSTVGWLYSQLGGTPIHRGKLDIVGLRSARHLFANGSFPLAAAPEGATNGHNEIISPLEPGIAQLGFWCVEDLKKNNRPEEVLILPVGMQYRYLTPPWQALERLLAELEETCGITEPLALETLPQLPESEMNDPQSVLSPQQQVILYGRLYRLGEHLLTQMEAFYRRFYHQQIKTDPQTPFAERLSQLLDTALGVAEQFFNIPPKGNAIDRCRRLEEAGWAYIYREDIPNLEVLSPLERSLANRIAQEADLRLWHMRLVESFVAVTGRYVQEKPSAERFADTALLLWDAIARIQGTNPFNRPRLGKQSCQITIGEPLSVSQRWETYTQNRARAKQAVTDLTQDLQQALSGLIVSDAG
ncbi:MAG: 1-acyl-sn-glycerol-3-phosphate acyltransferase [Desertifilum sp.]|nr:1-acyl-sn-glycerol-3-phosphate acyltransferase [Desertifilum sp.]